MVEEIIVNCPHCENKISIMSNEINCGIFRHGLLKRDYSQINPHETKDICDRLYENGEIFGCGKPFRLLAGEKYEAIKCDYI